MKKDIEMKLSKTIINRLRIVHYNLMDLVY